MCTGEGHAPAEVNEAIKVQEQVAGRGAVSSCCLASHPATIAAAVLVSLTGPLHYCAAPPFISCGDTLITGPNYFRHCYLVIMMAASRTPQPTTSSTPHQPLQSGSVVHKYFIVVSNIKFPISLYYVL